MTFLSAKMILRICGATLVASALSACAVDRPESAMCRGLVPASTFELPAPPTSQEPVMDEETAIARSAAPAIARAVAADRRGAVELNVLSLSAGGQYGAFGAGFLRGWGEDRPSFDLVTGVSAGSLLAPVAFAGPEFDPILDDYDGLSDDDVLRENLLAAPFSPSVASTEPLKALLNDRLSDDLIARIAERQMEENAQLFVAATNIDTTANRIFSLSDVAASGADIDVRRDCMREVIMASSAIPVFLPPRNIDDNLYADGGLRDHVFFRGIESARAQVARQTGRTIRVNAFIVVNGQLRTPEEAGEAEDVEDNILAYALRAADILADETLRDSIAETIRFAQEQPGWTVEGVFADTAIPRECREETGRFNPCVTRHLFDYGKTLGSARPLVWLDGDTLLEITNKL
ncbi:patatin-like phospholipase family protein [Cognatiyoonia sp. IB215446]|uniref:patatin-like phospholipase family protein n=1 Tax=Cognatiyoonia sp. IB215446 TaxID=3097355 RepID=UPI002A0DDA9A|nr:patatin-like phospholipase family protein [Cognatiyoonia sp. IB215446]MDX8346474.1 patatin-like phospholipase family protein [Cognatiyoonia sp. IB215446]